MIDNQRFIVQIIVSQGNHHLVQTVFEFTAVFRSLTIVLRGVCDSPHVSFDETGGQSREKAARLFSTNEVALGGRFTNNLPRKQRWAVHKENRNSRTLLELWTFPVSIAQ